MTNLKNLSLLFFALFLCACSSPQTTGKKSDAVLMGLEDPERITDKWSELTPVDQFITPQDFATGYHAFDYWVLDAQEDHEKTWSAFSATLDFLRTDSQFNATQHMTLNSLLASLEGATPQLDYTFFVAGQKPVEGLAIRYGRTHAEGATSSMTVVMQRGESSEEAFSSLWIWLDPGFSELPRITLFAVHSGTTWSALLIDGIFFTVDSNQSLDVTPVLTVLQSLWKATLHSAYVERASEPKDPPRLMPPALALSIHDRAIESVLTDTVFPPRLTLGPNK